MAAYELKERPALAILSMGGEPRPRTRDGAPKLSPDGRPTFSTGVVVARDGGGTERGATVAVIEPAEFPVGTQLRFDGRVWLTPYVTDAGRQGLSFLAERLVARKPATPVGVAPEAQAGGR